MPTTTTPVADAPSPSGPFARPFALRLPTLRLAPIAAPPIAAPPPELTPTPNPVAVASPLLSAPREHDGLLLDQARRAIANERVRVIVITVFVLVCIVAAAVALEARLEGFTLQ